MDKKVENLMSYKNPMALHGKKIKKSKKETKQPPPSALTAHAKFKSIRKANGNHPPISREPPPGMTPKISTERKTVLETKLQTKFNTIRRRDSPRVKRNLLNQRDQEEETKAEKKETIVEIKDIDPQIAKRRSRCRKKMYIIYDWFRDHSGLFKLFVYLLLVSGMIALIILGTIPDYQENKTELQKDVLTSPIYVQNSSIVLQEPETENIIVHQNHTRNYNYTNNYYYYIYQNYSNNHYFYKNFTNVLRFYKNYTHNHYIYKNYTHNYYKNYTNVLRFYKNYTHNYYFYKNFTNVLRFYNNYSHNYYIYNNFTHYHIEKINTTHYIHHNLTLRYYVHRNFTIVKYLNTTLIKKIQPSNVLYFSTLAPLYCFLAFFIIHKLRNRRKTIKPLTMKDKINKLKEKNDNKRLRNLEVKIDALHAFMKKE